LSGQHAVQHHATRDPRRHPNLIPATVGVVVAALLIGAAIATVRLGPAEPKASADAFGTDDRASADRIGSGELRGAPSQSQSSSSSPSAAPASPPPSRSPSPTPSRAAPSRTPSKPSTVVSSGTCAASYYATGTQTASGERFNPDGLTAAHRTL